MLKKFITKRTAKRMTTLAAKKEVSVVAGVLLTIATHKIIQKMARKYPQMNFLKVKTFPA